MGLLKASVRLLQDLLLCQQGLSFDLVHSALELIKQVFPKRGVKSTHDNFNHAVGRVYIGAHLTVYSVVKGHRFHLRLSYLLVDDLELDLIVALGLPQQHVIEDLVEGIDVCPLLVANELIELVQLIGVRLLHLLRLPINLRVEDGHEPLNELLRHTLHFLIVFVVFFQICLEVVDLYAQLVPLITCCIVTESYNLNTHRFTSVSIVPVTLLLKVMFVPNEIGNSQSELNLLLVFFG